MGARKKATLFVFFVCCFYYVVYIALRNKDVNNSLLVTKYKKNPLNYNHSKPAY